VRDVTATTYVALLRGINLGSRNRIAMGRLRELLADLGYPDSVTHLQSGNVVLTAARTNPEVLASAIEKRIARDLGLTVPVVVRSRDQLAEAIERNPMPQHTDEPAKLHVAFLSATPAKERVQEIDPGRYEPDEFQVVGRDIYLWYPKGLHASRLTHTFWEKRLGVTATARNWNTVTALMRLAEG
jgi:uncharacterized protein (DUF1697 family)